MLEQYQRDLGIYKPEINYNQIGSLRSFGFVMLAIILLVSIGFAIWVFLYQTNRVVQFSQPPFLYLLCVGTFVLGSAILPKILVDLTKILFNIHRLHGQDGISSHIFSSIRWRWDRASLLISEDESMLDQQHNTVISQ